MITAVAQFLFIFLSSNITKGEIFSHFKTQIATVGPVSNRIQSYGVDGVDNVEYHCCTTEKKKKKERERKREKD